MGSLSLANSEPFGGISDEDERILAPLSQSRRFHADEVLFDVGDEAHTLFVVGDGKVELAIPLRVKGETRDVRVQSVEAGRALAWSALVPPHLMTMRARATTAGSLLCFERSVLLDLFARRLSIGLVVFSNLAGVISRRLQETQALWVRQVQRDINRTYL